MNAKLLYKLIAFPIITGATFNIAAYAVHYFSPPGAAAWRFGIAGLLLLGYIIIKRKFRLQTIKENLWIFMILGIVGVFGFNSLFFLGMKSTTPTNGALIMATNPLLTVLFSGIVLRTTVTLKQWIGILFSMTGVILVITHGSWQMISHLSVSIGDLFILLGNACWALYGVLSRRYAKNSSSMETTTYTMIIGALGLISISFFTTNPVPLPDIPVFAWCSILFMSLFTSVLGYLWWNEAIATIGANRTAIFFNLVPVATMVISFMTGDALTIVQVSGAGFVILGVLLSTVDSLRILRVHKSKQQSVVKA